MWTTILCRRFWRANSKFEPEGRYPSAPYGHEWKAVSAVIEKESTPDKEIKPLQLQKEERVSNITIYMLPMSRILNKVVFIDVD